MEGCLPLFPAIDWLSLFRMAAARLFAPKEDAKPVETVSISQQAAQILDTYGDTILRYAYSYLHNQSDTEEVLQDTLIQFLKTRPVFESDEHEKAWLLRVAGNLCKNRLKYNSLRQTDELREELIAEQREGPFLYLGRCAGIAGAVPGGYPPFLPGGLLHPGDQSNSGAKRGNDPL